MYMYGCIHIYTNTYKPTQMYTHTHTLVHGALANVRATVACDFLIL